MGSITSHPVIPAAAQTVYVPVYTQPSVTTATVTSPTTTATSESSEPVAAKNTSLLKRSRGVLSTVVTGFRGLLSDGNNTTPPRKTLLGE